MTNDSPFHRGAPMHAITRRDFLWRSGGGLGGIALAALLDAAPLPHHRPRATRVVQMFMAGAASHVDLFDYKPELKKRDEWGVKPDKGFEIKLTREERTDWQHDPLSDNTR